MGRLFGTDGARGIANQELTCELAMNIGRAAAMVLTNGSQHPKILIGKDTRLSCNMLEGALVAGLCSIGANVELLGAVPTPAVAYLVRKYHADAGIMISASHNSFEFNGIKIFSGNGYKLPDELEAEIESIVLDHAKLYETPVGDGIGRVTRSKTAVSDYIDHIVEAVPCHLDGMEVAIDCSNGAASATAETLFTRLGAKCHILSAEPDGVNINAGCGSTHLERLQQYVKDHHLPMGVAFDGDADRCLAVDETGSVVDGDAIMAICAKEMADSGKLAKNTAVGTIMSNMGFSRFCSGNGLQFVATNVGDRYVLEAMLKEGYNFGGEQSGHVIFLDHSTTGDGQLTAAKLLHIVHAKKATLSEIAGVMTKYPQVLLNVKVTNEGKAQFRSHQAIQDQIEAVRQQLGEEGRILVRLSGTEPLVRVMLEGSDKEKITALAQETADFIAQEIGQ